MCSQNIHKHRTIAKATIQEAYSSGSAQWQQQQQQHLLVALLILTLQVIRHRGRRSLRHQQLLFLLERVRGLYLSSLSTSALWLYPWLLDLESMVLMLSSSTLAAAISSSSSWSHCSSSFSSFSSRHSSSPLPSACLASLFMASHRALWQVLMHCTWPPVLWLLSS